MILSRTTLPNNDSCIFSPFNNVLFKVLRPGDGHWGTWTEWNSCPKNSYARSFRLRLERKQGSWYDDSGLNAVQIKCEDIYGTETRFVK